MTTQRRHLSLVELIVAVILMGLLGALVSPYVTGLRRRMVEPVLQAQAATTLVQVAERISHDYEADASLRSDLAAFRDRIVNRTGNYGSYDAAICSFVKFENGIEVPGTETDILKVKLGNTGAVFVLLFPYWTP